MNTDSLLKRGYVHPAYCEDALFKTSIRDTWYIGAVMDGCSSAIESCFIATLYSKLISKGCKLLPYLYKIQPEFSLNNQTTQMIGEFLLNQIFLDLIKIQKQLMLDNIEILSTLALVVLNNKTGDCFINYSGDGFYSVNNELFEIDQNNTPDFMGYHTEKTFDTWFNNHSQSSFYSEVTDVVLATDGVTKLLTKDGKKHNTVITERALMLKSEKNTEQRLNEVYDNLTQENELIPYDDIAILRFHK